MTTSNGKKDTIRINVKEEPKKEIATTVQTIAMDNNIIKNDGSNNTIAIKKTDDSNPVGTVMALGVLGGGGYWVYKKSKKGK